MATSPAGHTRDVDAAPAIAAPDTRAVFVALAVLLAELAILAGVNAGWLAPLVGLLLHAAIVAFSIVCVKDAVRRNVDTGPSVLLAVATAVVGPLGALGCVIMGWLVSLGRESPDLLQAWYKRISLSTETDPVTRLSDTVAIGRSLDLASPLPSSFATVLQHGSIADQQRVLGLIARKFHPDYLPVLKLALAHEAPVVRVQAAAVAAHVRLPLSRFVEATLDRVSAPGVTPVKGLQAVREIRLCLQSGLLDERDRVRIDRLVTGLETRCFADVEHLGAVRARLDQASLGDYEGHLLNSGKFAEFRATRRRLRRRLFGRYVLRHTPWLMRSMPAVQQAAGQGA
jgi:hypothetical protein